MASRWSSLKLWDCCWRTPDATDMRKREDSLDKSGCPWSIPTLLPCLEMTLWLSAITRVKFWSLPEDISTEGLEIAQEHEIALPEGL